MMRRWSAALVVVLGTAGVGPAVIAPAVSAATTHCLVVDTNSDHSYGILQDAVNAATAGDTLFVKGTCSGATEIDKNLTVAGQSASGTKSATLEGDVGSVLLIDAGATVKLNTLIITRGRPLDGGGIDNEGGMVTMNGSTVTGNHAFQTGGGIYNDGGAVTLNNSIVTANDAAFHGAGGGIFTVGGAITLNGSSSVTANTADKGCGIYSEGATVTLNDGSTISGGDCRDGGGVLSHSGTLTLNDSSSVSNNHGFFGDGGVESDGGAVTLNDNSSISNNHGDRGDGGIGNGGTLTLNDNSSISNNTTLGFGGGVGNGGTVTLNDESRISNNSAGAEGGGIYNRCGGTLIGAAAGPSGNVYDNQPDDIFFEEC